MTDLTARRRRTALTIDLDNRGVLSASEDWRMMYAIDGYPPTQSLQPLPKCEPARPSSESAGQGPDIVVLFKERRTVASEPRKVAGDTD